MDHPRPSPPGRRVGELEECEDAPGFAELGSVIEVIEIGRVEVDGLLDQAEAEKPGVEIHVAPSVGSYRRYVMNSI
jgi:hypothetical protein